MRSKISTEAVQRLGPADLCRIASSSLIERRSDVPFWRAIASRAIEVAPFLDQTQASKLIHLIQSGEAASCDSIAKLSEVITKRADQSSGGFDLSPTDLRKLVVAICRGKAYNSELLSSLLDSASDSISSFPPQHQIAMIAAIGRLRFVHEKFITASCESLAPNLSGAALHDCVSLADALSRLGVHAAPVFDASAARLRTGAALLDVEDLRVFFLSLARLKRRGVERDDSAVFSDLILLCLKPQIRRLETRELFQVFFATAELNALDGAFIRENLIPTLCKRISLEPNIHAAALALQLLARLPFSSPGGAELRAAALGILEGATVADIRTESAAVVCGALAGARVWGALEEAGPAALERLKEAEFQALAEAAAKSGRLIHAVKVERLRRSI